MRSIVQFPIAVAAFTALLCGCGSSSSSTAQTTSSEQPSRTSSAVADSTPVTAAPTASATTPSKDSCAIVTSAEIASTTGKTITGAPTRVNDFVCRFSTSDGGTVNIGIASPVTAANFRSNAQGQGQPPVSGIGDAAYQSSFGVSVLVGTTSVSIEVFPVAGGGYLDPALKLARLVISRL